MHCTARELLAAAPNRSIGAIVTDPPMSLAPTDIRATVIEASRAVRLGGAFVVIGDAVGWRRILPRRGFVWMAELVCLWGDRRVRPNNFDSLYSTIGWYARAGVRHTFDWEQRSIPSNVIQCQRVPRAERVHPSEKPVGLTNFLVSLLTRHDDLIVDPFCGSGTTLVSAEMCGRPWSGGDIDQRWCEHSQRRVVRCEVEDIEKVYLWINGQLEEV